MSSSECHQHGCFGMGVYVLWEPAKGTGLVQSGEERASGGPNSSPGIHEEVIEKVNPGSSQQQVVEGWETMGELQHEFLQEMFRLGVRKTSISWGQWNSGTSTHRVSVLGGFQVPARQSIWANWSTLVADPALSRRLNQSPPKMLSNLSYVILLCILSLSCEEYCGQRDF